MTKHRCCWWKLNEIHKYNNVLLCRTDWRCYQTCRVTDDVDCAWPGAGRVGTIGLLLQYFLPATGRSSFASFHSQRKAATYFHILVFPYFHDRGLNSWHILSDLFSEVEICLINSFIEAHNFNKLTLNIELVRLVTCQHFFN